MVSIPRHALRVLRTHNSASAFVEFDFRHALVGAPATTALPAVCRLAGVIVPVSNRVIPKAVGASSRCQRLGLRAASELV